MPYPSLASNLNSLTPKQASPSLYHLEDERVSDDECVHPSHSFKQPLISPANLALDGQRINDLLKDLSSRFGIIMPPSSSSASMLPEEASLNASLFSPCKSNCSGHGECFKGTCFCQVEYAGDGCHDPNMSYFITFSTIFYVISVVSFVQLVLCINSEYNRLKPRSLLRSFRITTQKALYFFICVASGLRGFYFSASYSPASNSLMSNMANFSWTKSLMSAYYPVLLSGSSLVVCFWAEVFHLHDVSPERPGFLSKSFTGFILFNVVTYSLLLAEMVLLQFSDASETDQSLFISVFNSLYAVLMFIVVVFFLIYGVEVYFKIRGAFIQGETCPADLSQLHQSRLGLVSQAALLLVTVLFIISDVLGSHWKNKVPVLSRNTHEIMFRVVELGVALWFPCCLWNCVKPEALWILNPRKILKKGKTRETQELKSLVDTTHFVRRESQLSECWICYDSERKDAGPLIQPCLCRGDVSAVHHDCLKTWLMESNSNPDHVKCKVCNEGYRIQKGDVWLPAGLTISHWFQTAAIVSIMCSAAAGACMAIRLFDHMYVRTISVGVCILVEYICLRFLGFNLVSAYNRAKMSAIKIGGSILIQEDEQVIQSNTRERVSCTDSSSSEVDTNSQVSLDVSLSSSTATSSSFKSFQVPVIMSNTSSPSHSCDEVIIVHDFPKDKVSPKAV